MISVLSVCVLATALLIMPGCKQESDDAINYLESITGHQNKIIKKLLVLVKKFEGRDPVAMSMGLRAFQEQVDISIEKVSSIQGYKGETTMRDACLDLFDLYKDVAAKEYKEMIEILGRRGSITQTDVDYLQRMQEDIGEREQGLDAALAKAQKDFADKYNFRLKSNKYQKEIDKL